MKIWLSNSFTSDTCYVCKQPINRSNLVEHSHTLGSKGVFLQSLSQLKFSPQELETIQYALQSMEDSDGIYRHDTCKIPQLEYREFMRFAYNQIVG